MRHEYNEHLTDTKNKMGNSGNKCHQTVVKRDKVHAGFREREFTRGAV